MIRHCVMFTFAADTTPAQIAAMEEGLRSLPDVIPQIHSYVMGPDAGLAEGNMDYAVVGDFETVEDYRTYASHEAHVAVIDERIKPIIASRVALQYEH